MTRVERRDGCGAGITSFQIANFVLINVQFVLLPIVFVLFFDVSVPFRRRFRVPATHAVRNSPATTDEHATAIAGPGAGSVTQP